jgi:hyperosmotically inducible protein
MKTLIAALLATAAGATFAAPTFSLNHDPATYRNATQKAAADYKEAVAKCDAMSGNGKDVCQAEAKLARTQAEAKVMAQYSSTPLAREKARTSLAEAEFTLAKARCDAKSGADKDDCTNTAKSVHTAALADAKADRTTAAGASAAGATASGGLVTGTDTRDPAKAAAADKCAQAAGDAKTACLVETKPSPVREGAAAVAKRTENAADNAGDKARDAAAVATDKTKAVAAVAADKTREVAQVAAEKSREVAAGAADKSKEATAKTRVVVADTAITTKVKAGLVKEPDLGSLGIHVETEKGVVMLSGFVKSTSEAERAVKVAKAVDGVSTVRSAIQVK